MAAVQVLVLAVLVIQQVEQVLTDKIIKVQVVAVAELQDQVVMVEVVVQVL
jgi:hypothetical protein